MFILLSGVLGCSPTGNHAQAPAPAPREESAVVPFKRVDHWQFVDLARPPSAVEVQLRRYFERLFPKAQYSEAYTCMAREEANFREQYSAAPDEELEENMGGRCGAPSAGDWASTDYYSDGTILDSPLSPQALHDIAASISEHMVPFSVFGITARYVGTNALVLIETALPGATIFVGEPGADHNVRVKGRILGDFKRAHALINQGEAGSATCNADSRVEWPEYAFQCPMAAGDQEAWVNVSADMDEGSMESPLVELPAHVANWVPPVAYQRKHLTLEQVDTPTALLIAINALRAQLGRRKLTLASEQSRFMQSTYDKAFAMNATGNWLGDNGYRVQMLRGDRVSDNVSWGQIASGIAFDGNAADWLAYRLLFPVSRGTLMADNIDQIAIATHGDPSVGFGAAAVVYSLLTPARERALREELNQSISKLRGKLPTQRLENPPELEAVAREIAAGHLSPRAFALALRQANLGRKDNRDMAGLLLPLDSSDLDDSLEVLLSEPRLSYGIVVTHARGANNWVSPFGFVWYLTKPKPGTEREARR